MQYDEFSYLYPPRPQKPVPHGVLPYYEKRGWVAQVKKNGDCTVIFTNGRDVIFRTRHGDVSPTRWSPTPEIMKFFTDKTKHKWDVYVGELIHNKTPLIKNQLYIFDKIVHQGEQLVGSTFDERQSILQCQWEGDVEEHFVRITKNIVVARNFTSGFSRMYNSIVERHDNLENEGLVLKNPTSVLKPCYSSMSNSWWQVKIRRPHKNYSF